MAVNAAIPIRACGRMQGRYNIEKYTHTKKTFKRGASENGVCYGPQEYTHNSVWPKVMLWFLQSEVEFSVFPVPYIWDRGCGNHCQLGTPALTALKWNFPHTSFNASLGPQITTGDTLILFISETQEILWSMSTSLGGVSWRALLLDTGVLTI